MDRMMITGGMCALLLLGGPLLADPGQPENYQQIKDQFENSYALADRDSVPDLSDRKWALARLGNKAAPALMALFEENPSDFYRQRLIKAFDSSHGDQSIYADYLVGKMEQALDAPGNLPEWVNEALWFVKDERRDKALAIATRMLERPELEAGSRAAEVIGAVGDVKNIPALEAALVSWRALPKTHSARVERTGETLRRLRGEAAYRAGLSPAQALTERLEYDASRSHFQLIFDLVGGGEYQRGIPAGTVAPDRGWSHPGTRLQFILGTTMISPSRIGVVTADSMELGSSAAQFLILEKKDGRWSASRAIRLFITEPDFQKTRSYTRTEDPMRKPCDGNEYYIQIPHKLTLAKETIVWQQRTESVSLPFHGLRSLFRFTVREDEKLQIRYRGLADILTQEIDLAALATK